MGIWANRAHHLCVWNHWDGRCDNTGCTQTLEEKNRGTLPGAGRTLPEIIPPDRATDQVWETAAASRGLFPWILCQGFRGYTVCLPGDGCRAAGRGFFAYAWKARQAKGAVLLLGIAIYAAMSTGVVNAQDLWRQVRPQPEAAAPAVLFQSRSQPSEAGNQEKDLCILAWPI